MTEREYTIEMLCCTPIELLMKRAEGKYEGIPEWLIGMSDELIEEARAKYYDPAYVKIRAEMLRCI